LKTSNININSTRKISDHKIYALKVERILNTFENLNSFEMTLKMLKTMQIYQKCIFWGFHCFFAIFWFFSVNLSKTRVKNWVATLEKSYLQQRYKVSTCMVKDWTRITYVEG